jgi:glucan phosphorylase
MAKEVKLQEEDGIVNMLFRLMPLLLILGALGGAYIYYKDTQERLQLAAANLARAETAAEANKQAYDLLIVQQEETQQQLEQLNQELQQAEAYQDELIGKLRRHNLTMLSMQKPGLIETRVNNATKAIFDELEAITAVPSE